MSTASRGEVTSVSFIKTKSRALKKQNMFRPVKKQNAKHYGAWSKWSQTPVFLQHGLKHNTAEIVWEKKKGNFF